MSVILRFLRWLGFLKRWTAVNFKGQLVFQWPGSSEAHYRRLLAIEKTIRQGLGAIGLVDGHDIGADEMNVFIHTDDPKGSFEKTMSLIQGEYDLKELVVGYRNFEDNHYTPVFPPGLTVFRVA
jgi:hypothetical protein